MDNSSRQANPNASRVFDAFIHCISRYKHYGFREENEVRVVALPLVIDKELLKLDEADGAVLKLEKESKIRNQNGKSISYIELFDSSDIVLPIEQVIVGPHKEKNARVTTLQKKLRDMKIEIICSEIPFAD